MAAARGLRYTASMARAIAYEDMPPLLAGRARDLPPAATPEPGVLFDALLYPNRSLPNAGFVAVMTVVIGVNATLGVLFFLLGAWPIIGFAGLDVLLVWIAFRLSYRQGRLHERVRVTPDALWVSRVLPSGHETRWLLQPYWTRVFVKRPIDEESAVRVSSKGRTLVLGAFLSPEERGAFAEALQEAIARACRAAL